MKRPSHSRSSQVLAAAANGFQNYVVGNGGDADVILGRAGLRSEDIAKPTNTLSLAAYCGLLEEAAAQTRNPGFGLMYGSQFEPTMFGLIGFIALASPSIGSALQNFVELFPFHQNGTETRIVHDGALIRLEYRILDPAIIDRRQDAEFTLAAFANVARHCFGRSWRPVRFEYEHPEPEQASLYRTGHDSEILYLQPTNALVFRNERLATLMPTGDLQLLDLLRSSLIALAGPQEQDDVTIRARAEIRGRLASRSVSLIDVADRLKLPTWTLQRRLAEQGLTFSLLVDDVRKDLASLYIRQPHIALSDIALLVGYSEASAFSRAFNQWHGTSPQKFRKARRIAPC